MNKKTTIIIVVLVVVAIGIYMFSRKADEKEVSEEKTVSQTTGLSSVLSTQGGGSVLAKLFGI